MGETKGFGKHLATVIAISAVSGAVLFVLLQMSGFLSLGGTTKVRAIVPQAGNLTQGTSVTMAGARVGVVTGVSRRGVGALVDIRIDDSSVTPLPADTTAQLSVRTPLGENYVELLPGDAKEALEDNGIVPANREAEFVDVDQILSTLQGRRRERAQRLIQGLGAAVDNRGEELNRTLDGAASVLESGSAITGTLHAERERVADVVESLGNITQAIGERQESIEVIARQGIITFNALASRDAKVRELLDVLPGTLREVRTATQNVGALSDTGAPVLANLAAALTDVKPAFARLAPAASEGRAVVRRLDAAAPKLETTLDAAAGLAPEATAALPKVSKLLCQVNPALRYLRPYTRDVLSLVEGFGAATNSYDAIGHTIRLMPLFGENSALALPPDIQEAAYELTHKGIMESQTPLGFEPYPEPLQINHAYDSGQAYPNLRSYFAAGNRYPRVLADC